MTNLTTKAKELDIRTEEYLSDKFGTDLVRVISLQLYRGSRRIANMDFVLRKTGNASVSASGGTIGGMERLTKHFITVYKPNAIRNQVYKASEMKAMYRSGLIYGTSFSGAYSLKLALEALRYKQATGIMVSGLFEASER